MSVALAFAFVAGFVALKLGLPPILGYLLAGIAVGPFTPGFEASPELAPQLAEIGVILLMFGVGIHFSPRKLLAVRNIAIPGAIVQGRYDVVCPMRSAWDLHRAWPEAELHIVPDSGHSAFEAGISRKLVEATDALAERLADR